MISFVIPIYNESEFINIYLNKLTDYLNKNLKENYEILIINDGSTDNIENISKKWINKRIKLISYKINKGKGFAIKYAGNFIRGNYIIMMDADLPSQINLKIIKKIKDKLKEKDIIIGSRY